MKGDGQEPATGLQIASPTALRITQAAGRQVLLVKLPPGGSTRYGADDRVTFLVGEDEAKPATILVPAGIAALEFREQFIACACGKPDLRLRAVHQAAYPKVSLLADRIVATGHAGAVDDIVTSLLWIALARSIGSAFGNEQFRASDTWLNPGALQRTVELIESNLGSDLPVASMASGAGLSPSAFLRAFRGSTGITPGEFVLERRIALGANLLISTTMPVGDIALKAGFKSSNHFSTTFLRRRGMPPSIYRRNSEVGPSLDKALAARHIAANQLRPTSTHNT